MKYKPTILTLTITLLIILTISIAFASSPTWTHTIDIDDEIINGENNVGRVIFDIGPYTPEFHNLNNITPLIAQQHDIIEWNGNVSVEIRLDGQSKKIITPSDPDKTFRLSQSTPYTIHPLNNQSDSATITVTQADPAIITPQYTSTFLDVVFNPETITLSNQKNINLTINAPKDLTPGEYDYTIIFTSENNDTSPDQISISRNATLIPVHSWNVTTDTVKTTHYLKAGSFTPVGGITIINNGNIDYNITSSVTGNGSSFVQIAKEHTLFRGIPVTFSPVIQIPERQEDGLYKAKIVLSAFDTTHIKNLTINVTDTTPPEIKRVQFSHDFLYRENEISVEATDNLNITKATAKVARQYYNETDNTTHTINQSYNLTKDQQIYYTPINFTIPTQYNITLCVSDASGNTQCDSQLKTFEKVPAITSHENVTLPSKKHGLFAKKQVLTYHESIGVPITITLTDFNSNQQETNTTKYFTGENPLYKLRIVDGDGSIKNLDGVGSSVEVYETGNIYIEARGEKVSRFDGVINISTPEYVKEVDPITFRGEHLDYDLPEPAIKNIMGREYDCDVEDTGDLATSKYKCSVTFDATTNLDNLIIPLTPEEIRLQKQQTNQTIQEYMGKLNTRNAVMSGLVFATVILVLLTMYAVRIHPYLRWRKR